jgi:hypothetical protein
MVGCVGFVEACAVVHGVFSVSSSFVSVSSLLLQFDVGVVATSAASVPLPWP